MAAGVPGEMLLSTAALPSCSGKKIGEDPNLDLHWATPTGNHLKVSPFADHW